MNINLDFFNLLCYHARFIFFIDDCKYPEEITPAIFFGRELFVFFYFFVIP